MAEGHRKPARHEICCVELAESGEFIALRDSKAVEHGALVFTRAELAAFLDGAKRGEFDHLV